MQKTSRHGASVLAAALVLAACGTGSTDDPEIPPLTVRDLAAPDRPGSQPLEAPPELVDEVPEMWVSKFDEMTSVLEQTARAALLDEEVWTSTDPLAVTDALLAPYERANDTTLDPTSLVDDFQNRAPDGTNVITQIAAVFPSDGQPTGDPVVYKAAWEVTPVDDVEGTSNTTRFRLVVWVGYPVPTVTDESPVVVGRQFDSTIARTDDGGTSDTITPVAAYGGLADECPAVLDGVLRPAGRLAAESIALLQREFASDEANDPADVVADLPEAISGSPYGDDDQATACLADVESPTPSP